MMSRAFIGCVAFAAFGLPLDRMASGQEQEKAAPAKSIETAPAKPTEAAPPKSSPIPSKKNAERQPAKKKAITTRSPKITIAFLPAAKLPHVAPEVSIELACRIKVEPGRWKPALVAFRISPEGRPNVSYGSVGAGEFTRKDDVFFTTAHLKAPRRPGTYRISAKAFGFDPRTPGPALAPAANGAWSKPGPRANMNPGKFVEFQAPEKLEVIVVGLGDVR